MDEKIIKTSFYYSQKMIFKNIKNTKNKNIFPFSNNFFLCFL